MSHITGTIQTLGSPITLGPASGQPPTSGNTWALDFAHTPAPGGTKLVILHFQNVSLPAGNRLEVDLGYGTDVFTSASGTAFWTRPANIYVLPGGLIPVRYVAAGSLAGSVQIDRYGRGESHAGEPGHPSVSNSDPFQKDAVYAEPTYDPWWFCSPPPNWENAACAPPGDVRAKVMRSVGMIVSVETSDFTGLLEVSTCTVTLVDADKVVTAGHCHSPAEALDSSVVFGYHTDCAGNRPAGYNAKFYKVKAVISHRFDGTFDGAHDYSLLQLEEAPAGVPVVQMRPSVPAAGEQVFGVHHPNGAVMKLSLPHPGFDTVLASNATKVNVHSSFHVSGGSSGSGLFDTAGRIVGVLSAGDPCHSATSPLKYFPTATILTDIEPAPPPPVTRDVMVVIDRSGSMSEGDGTGRTKIEVARDAASLFVQLVRASVGNRAGLVSFSTTAATDAALAAVTPAAKTSLLGPAPFSGGKVGALAPGGATSIGAGIEKARLQFPSPGANPRAILLLTDGMQNTPPMVGDVEGALGSITVHAVGLGTDANLDGALLTALTTAHGGVYHRAGDGLALQKFFSSAFGNIFEAGVLFDPELFLDDGEPGGKPQPFHVCGEEAVTVVAGWDQPAGALQVEVSTPGGATLTAGAAGTESSSGRTWAFLRIPLPHGGERDGTWSANVRRPGFSGEFPPPQPALRYFLTVVPTGGPRLLRVPAARRYYTGDAVNPLVMLRYPDGSWPAGSQVRVTVSRPGAGMGNLLSRAGLGAAVEVSGDVIPARQATLAALEARAGGEPLVRYTDDEFELEDDAENTNGSFEPGGQRGRLLRDHLRVEGTYTFHARAAYGQGCTATRELVWSLHVDVGVDPGRTGVSVTLGGTRPDGTRGGAIVLTPRDRYGNDLGPGRLDGLDVGGAAGTTVTGTIQDNGDGTYTVPVAWDPGSGNPPGVVVGQPGRPPVVVHEPRPPAEDCRKWKHLFRVFLIIALILLLILIVVLLT